MRRASSASVASASTIPNTDAKNIPLRVDLSYQKDANSSVNWQDEVLMVREGTCWVVDDIRYLNVPAHATNGSVRRCWKPVTRHAPADAGLPRRSSRRPPTARISSNRKISLPISQPAPQILPRLESRYLVLIFYCPAAHS